MNSIAAVGTFIICFFIMIIIFVGIFRWIFRINDIIKRLDSIINALQASLNLEKTKKK